MYCVNGVRTVCPDGTWNDWTNAKSLEECIPCPRGMFCNPSLMFAAQAIRFVTESQYASPLATLGPAIYATYFGPCTDGYICVEGSSLAIPTTGMGFDCPPGYFCKGKPELGATVPTPCDVGTYQD
jgi:hypothetical protein